MRVEFDGEVYEIRDLIVKLETQPTAREMLERLVLATGRYLSGTELAPGCAKSELVSELKDAEAWLLSNKNS